MRLGRRRGFALLAVLWGVALLALLAVALGATARTEARIARNTAARTAAQALADGGVRYALAALTAPGAGLRRDGAPFAVAIDGTAVTVTVTEAGGLVDLNAAPPPLLAALFRAAGAAPERAARLADAVIDWRDGDDTPHPAGAEAFDYQAAGRPPPANRRFEALVELRLVLGVDDALYARALPFATLQSRRPGIDPRLAPLPLLFALPGVDPAAAAALAARRPLPRDAALGDLGAPPDLFAASVGDALEVEARAAPPGGPEARRRATVRLTGMLADPVWLHAWEDGA
ncbi:hypothetical protein [Azospirillum sp. ST 5-10]|uniref:hypothetical protein n=1 Tax=unclassified Azospirillum TaxID=2630922 RepID=UPI003F49F698